MMGLPYVYISFDGTNLKGFRSLLLSIAYPSSMCLLSLNEKVCNWVTQYPLAMGGVMYWSQHKDPGTGRKTGVWCGVWLGVQYIHGTHTKEAHTILTQSKHTV